MTAALLALALLCQAQPAPTVAVTPELVCTVQHAIKWSRPPWTIHRCESMAKAMNATPEPQEMLSIAVLESGMHPGGIAWHHGRTVVDGGLMGVRCVLGRDRRCTNWPVRGMTVRQLMRPRANVRAAARILAWKRRVCGPKAHDCYVGNPSGRKGRTGHVQALVAAFGGVATEVKDKRVSALVKRIAEAVKRKEPRT